MGARAGCERLCGRGHSSAGVFEPSNELTEVSPRADRRVLERLARAPGLQCARGSATPGQPWWVVSGPTTPRTAVHLSGGERMSAAQRWWLANSAMHSEPTHQGDFGCSSAAAASPQSVTKWLMGC